MEPVNVAVIQLCADGDHGRSMAVAEVACRRALAHGADLVVLPENYAGLAPDKAPWAFSPDRPLTGSALKPLADLTREHRGVIVAGGTPELAGGGRLHNTCVVLGSGEVLARYRKIHLFDADLPGEVRLRESDRIQRGEGAVLVRTGQYALGLSICYDVRFAELYRGLAQAGAEILAIPAAFTVPTGAAHWEVLVRARAIENQCFVLAAAQHGDHGGGRRSWGHSMVVDPWGRILAEQPRGDGILEVRLDPAALVAARTQVPSLTHHVAAEHLRVATVTVTSPGDGASTRPHGQPDV